MENIIEYIKIGDYKDLLIDMFNDVSGYSPLSYIECGARSWILDSSEDYQIKWKDWLDLQRIVHKKLCPLATGFNFNPTNMHTVPPHIDIDTPLYFNLLIPVFGIARINIFETNLEHLEFRHGMKHWKMVQDDKPKKKIGELIVDKPVLLNTDVLHDVEPIDSPRAVWCTRWVDIDKSFNFKSFKKHVESILNENN
jgi:hypothetical protein